VPIARGSGPRTAAQRQECARSGPSPTNFGHDGALAQKSTRLRTDAESSRQNRRKAKWLNRQEFVIVGWSDPEGSRPHLGALLLGYYTDGGKLIYAGRVGTGMPVKVLADLRRRLDPLARNTSPLSVPPSRTTRFGSPLIPSRVHWVEPKLVAEITYLTWTADGLLRHTVYVGLREDKLAEEVRRALVSASAERGRL
jgi:ATP-dependent DNA ligase